MNADGQRTEKRRNVRQVMAKTFVMVPAQLLSDVADKKITGSAFALYCYLLFRQGKKKQYWGSIEDICWGTGVSSAQVSRLLKQLVARNHISRVKRIGATWITYCLTRVEDGGKIVFRGGLIGDPFIDATMGRNSKNKPIASDSKLALNNSPEIYCGKSPSGNQIDEALRLFKETIPSNEVTEAAQMEKLERDIDEIFGKP